MGTNKNRVADLCRAVRRKYEKDAAEQTPPDPTRNLLAASGTGIATTLNAAANAAQDPAVAAGLSPVDRALIARWRLRQHRLNGGDDAA